MKKFQSVKDEYLRKGVSEDNIEYAISGVQYGTKREHLLEGLTADYRGMSFTEAQGLLS